MIYKLNLYMYIPTVNLNVVSSLTRGKSLLHYNVGKSTPTDCCRKIIYM